MLVLNAYTIVLALLLSLFLYFKSSKNLLNKLLALIFILPAVAFCINSIQMSGLNIPNLQFYLYIAYVGIYLFAPAVYCYINLLCGKKIEAKFWLFYVTVALVFTIIYFAVESIFYEEYEKTQMIEELRSGILPLKILILNAVFFITQLIYFTISTLEVYKLKKKLKNNLTDTEKTRIRYADIFIKLIWLLNGILMLLYAILPVDIADYVASPILFMVFYGFVGYFGLKYNVIFHFNDINPFHKKIRQDKDEENEFLAEIILNHLEQSKAYLNPEYSLTDLAKDINIFPSKVSQTINYGLNKNFSDLINSYRIETAKQILIKDRHLSVEGVALNSGFSSRATFYRVFKKNTGYSPTEYLDSL